MPARVALFMLLLFASVAGAVPLETTPAPRKAGLGVLLGQRLKQLECLVPWGRVLGGAEPGAEFCMRRGRSALCFAARVPPNPTVPPSMALSFSHATPRCP